MAQVPISQLPVEELNQYKESLEQEIQNMAQSLQAIKSLRERFYESKTCIEHLKEYKEGDKLLIPLTSSLYVRGEFGDTSQCIVDVGTGYYIKQSLDKSQDFMERKMAYIKENMDKLNEAIGTKNRQLEAIVGEMQKKIYQQQKEAGSSSQ
jgi:prefoldin alpha subunit|eukprot:CAMPEP_0174292680 /NCGR_PEP_ID=MMETSP0809-20121228/36226_1 /TAXON_ID=73025 ORGANISM="Eutreptiella gymnastica-like, Strain CCMP1594" /NCGR_SAMPLE_ID=MMETSP0809 /ASSEMBLY_ACC=CAM_ASM_000658 /LENGTH=150 /DNA_ID=CAMNT_0015392911 /DNA_START=24 /DNA_END=476 /DNA_ORIENTATION=+